MKNILHLIHDDKFFDEAFVQFDRFIEYNNLFLFITQDEHYEFKYIKNTERVIKIIENSEEYKILLSQDYDIVFIHFRDTEKSKAILALKPKTKIVWLAWGGDYYPKLRLPLFQPLTLQLINSIKNKPQERRGQRQNLSFLKRFTSRIRSFYRKFKKHYKMKYVYMKSMQRIGYCATVVPTEFALIRRIAWFRAKQVFFNYGSMKGFLENIEEPINLGDSILVGNSCTWENNHLEVFCKLKDIGITAKHIVVPLSYGKDIDDFAPVIEFGQKCFEGNFKPIFEFISFKDYITLLANCSVAIFNHERQQAVANIVIMLWIGATVFLSQNSPVYWYLKSLGVKIFTFQNDLTLDAINTPLTKAEVYHNRIILRKEYGYDAVIAQTQNLVEKVLND